MSLFIVTPGSNIISGWQQCSSQWGGRGSRPTQWSVQLEVWYLGYHLGSGQVRPQVEKTEVVAACPWPETKKQVRAFLELAGYYRQFIPAFSELTSPLTDLTRKGASDPVQWTEQCQTAFERAKKALCGEPLLHKPNFKFLSCRPTRRTGGRFVPGGGGRGTWRKVDVLRERHITLTQRAG